MRISTLRIWYQIHKWTSVICTAFMLLLCITGLPLIFHHEIDHALGYSVDPPALSSAAGRADVDAIIADAEARRPGDAVQFLVADPHQPNAWYVRMGETISSSDVSAFYTYDARSGQLLGDYPLNQGFMAVMLRLHVDMYAGLAGTLFLGAMGMLLAASLISGVVLYGPYMGKLAFGSVRRQRSQRIRWLDLHNLLGIVTLVWFLVVGLTGVINTLSIPIFGHWQSTQLAEMTATHRDHPLPAQRGSAAAAVAAAQRAEPDMQLSFMAFPGNPFAGQHHYMAFMQGTTALTAQVLKPVMVDAASAEVTASRNMPWYVTALLLSQPLHFGDYGGLPLKILWALLTVITIAVLGSGLYLWLKRRETPIEERLQKLRLQTAGVEAVRQ